MYLFNVQGFEARKTYIADRSVTLMKLYYTGLYGTDGK